MGIQVVWFYSYSLQEVYKRAKKQLTINKYRFFLPRRLFWNRKSNWEFNPWAGQCTIELNTNNDKQ